MPGVTLYLIRHGETDWNRECRYQGQRDIPLNGTGRRQARRNGGVLKGLLPQIADAQFISSPLSRTIETMEILCTEIGLEPSAYRIEPQLLELHYGHWEGQLASDLPRTDPEGMPSAPATGGIGAPRAGKATKTSPHALAAGSIP